MTQIFRVVQPWGRDRAREATLIGEHASVHAAFAQIDRLTAQMLRTGAPSNSIDLLVVDETGNVVKRPGAN
ncbi:MAG TPA: hypothetical protein VEA16_03245 [Vicinamibacterales bacterium]|nr:hypothetical protein [Vicinamibacterales bacterium]